MKKGKTLLTALLITFLLSLLCTATVFAASFKVNAPTSTYVGKTISLTSNGNSTVAWTSSNPTILKLTASKGKTVKAKALLPGTVKIQAKYGKTKRTVTVKVQNCSLSATNLTLYAGENTKLTLKNALNVVWSSTNPSVVKVERSAKNYNIATVTALSAGNANITAKVGNKTYKCPIMIKIKARLNLYGMTIIEGDKYKIKCYDANQTEWSTDNSGIASIESSTSSFCLVRGVRAGTASIYAKTEYGTLTFTLKVSKSSRKELNIDKIAPKADPRILNQFKKYGFRVYTDSSVNYTGYCDLENNQIILNERQFGIFPDTIYHELGHLVLWKPINLKLFRDLQVAYKAEKNLMTGVNKAYNAQNYNEYFAESVREYTLDPAKLKKERPLTYEVVKKEIEQLS